MNQLNLTLPKLGKVHRFHQGIIEASGLQVDLGTLCHLYDWDFSKKYLAEVIGFDDDKFFLMPYDNDLSLHAGTMVESLGHPLQVTIGHQMLGHVFDGLGQCLDDPHLNIHSTARSLRAKPLNPMSRKPIENILDVGVKSINCMLTIGQGQRVGLMAGSGVGKSVLLGMLAKNTNADIIVIGLIGERGREVSEFINHNISDDCRDKTVVVAVPADRSAIERTQGAYLATTIAEYFREQGNNVLLMLDSLTRFAMAQREISISLGEMPATKGYSSSVFRLLPELIERAGQGSADQGSITGIYTVLAEGDDQNDPIVDHSRAILDGHFVLSRELASSGHYPAIDIASSISRCANNLLSVKEKEAVMNFRKLWKLYLENQELVKMGVYKKGTDPTIDKALNKGPALENFLCQGSEQCFSYKDCFEGLGKTIL